MQQLVVEVGVWNSDEPPKYTKSASREVNPVFNSTVTLTDLRPDDRLQIVMKDVAMFSGSHLGGLIGPRLIGQCTLDVGVNFNGYIALETATTVPNNGPPLLEMEAQFFRSVAELRQFYEPGLSLDAPSSMQALTMNPSAPAQELVERQGVGRQGVEGVQASNGVRAVEDDGTPSPAPERPPTVMDASQTPADGASSRAWTSSVFYIDEAAKTFSPITTICGRLDDLQKRNLKFPFPDSPCRNYNILFCGYNKEPSHRAPPGRYFVEVRSSRSVRPVCGKGV